LIFVDGHCDTILKVYEHQQLYDLKKKAQLDLKRLQDLNINCVQSFAVFVESRFKPFHILLRGLQLIEIYHREAEKNKEFFETVRTKNCLPPDNQQLKIKGLLTVEGGEILCGNLTILQVLFRLGVRSICLTWNHRNEIADGCGESLSNSGLTSFGLEVVREMNHLGMIIDLSHISERGFWTVLEHSRDPVMVSHGNCRRLCDHVRNLRDEQIKALAEKGGILGITFVPQFLSAQEASIEDVLRHIDYAVNLVGPDHVGIGSDFDGTDRVVQGLEDVSRIGDLVEALEKRGYSRYDVEKIIGNNFLALFRQVLPE